MSRWGVLWIDKIMVILDWRSEGAELEWQLTSTGQLILQQHQVDGTRAASRAITLHDADVGAAAVVPRARVFTCRDRELR